MAVPEQPVLGLDRYFLADRTSEMLAPAQVPFEPGGRNLERVSPRDRVLQIEATGDLLGDLGHRVQVRAPVRSSDVDLEDRATGLAAELDIPEVELPPPGDRFGEVSDLFERPHRHITPVIQR